jgi:hypoxanthine phosphoribosyltransferase
METKYLFTTWSEYHLLAQKIAATILNHSEPFDEIIAIARGGLTFGHIMSDLLRLPIATFTIQSYKAMQKQGKVTITQEIGEPIKGKRILLIDDKSDTGKTFMRALKYINSFKPASVTTASMYLEPSSKFKPDYYAKQVNKWVIFPYEVVETITTITKQMADAGKSKAEIQEYLIQLGFREGQIAFVRKHHIT